jgi:hypothetical protein
MVANSACEDPQGDLAFFANFLQYGRQNAQWEWDSPSDRVYAGPFVTFTLEYDGESQWTTEQRQDFLATQLSWFRKSGANDLDRPIGAVYKHFSTYTDFLGLSACYSGNKSVHMHFLFSTDRVFEGNGDLLAHVRPGCQNLWERVRNEVHRILTYP